MWISNSNPSVLLPVKRQPLNRPVMPRVHSLGGGGRDDSNSQGEKVDSQSYVSDYAAICTRIDGNPIMYSSLSALGVDRSERTLVR